MKTLLELITIEMKEAFEAAGYDAAFAKVTLSNRPDLCEYQCNGAMAAAKTYKKAPIMIANDVVAGLQEKDCFEIAEAVNPGFINLKVKPSFAAAFLNEMAASEKLGVEEMETPKTIMVDYGGPNVAKPLHVGHLRSAIIGESVKRILRYKGNKVIGEVFIKIWKLRFSLLQFCNDQPHLISPVSQMNITDHFVSFKTSNPFYAFADNCRTQMSYMKRFRNIRSAVIYHDRFWFFRFFYSEFFCF